MSEESDPVPPFRRRRDRIRAEMGGSARIERLHARGERTVREHIDRLLDPGSFEEVGTFVRSARPEDADSTPGDGKIGGHGTIEGRPVTVAGDDITVKRGSSSPMGSKRLARLFGHAERSGHPIVYFGATGGARIPDTLGSAGFSEVPLSVDLFRRNRRVPFATVIVGDSFGGSSFVAAGSDLVVQLRGTCLAVTSPLVVEMATGEAIDQDALGGVDVHARTTGQIDAIADTPQDAYALVRRFLALLPANGARRAPRGPAGVRLAPDPELADLVPRRRSRAYDMTRVLRRVLDDDSLLELAPAYGRGLICALGRLDGHSRRRDRQPAEVLRRRAGSGRLREGGAAAVPVRRLRPARRLRAGRAGLLRRAARSSTPGCSSTRSGCRPRSRSAGRRS